jgi:hypothetical protein
MPWYCEPCKYQRKSKKQEERIRHWEQVLKAAREEIYKLKAGNISSSFIEQDISGHWEKPKNSKSRCRRFSANDISKVKLSNKFSVLATGSLEAAQQSPVLLKHGRRERKLFIEKNKSKRKILLLGSIHAREIGPLLLENLGSKFDICSIFKPIAPLSNVVEDLGMLGKDLTKQDHIIIVGGPGNSLDRNYHYSIEDDLNFIAERTSNTRVGFVNLFQRHDNTRMNGRVRSMSLRLDRALMRNDMSHIGVTDASSIVRVGYTRHGLQLNSRGKEMLVHLIAERVVNGHVSSISTIPVITNVRACPFLP